MFIGTVASSMHARHAPAVAKGFFATLQSAGAGGYGVAIINNVVRGTVVVAQAVKHAMTPKRLVPAS